MAESTKRRQGELVRKAFEILLGHPDGMRAGDVLKQMAEQLELTEHEKSPYASTPGVRRFDKIVRFSTIVHVKAGWLVKTKGLWVLTDEGRAAYQRYPDPEQFQREAIRLYREWRRGQPEPEDAEAEDVGDEDVSAAATIEEAEESAWAEVEAHLARMNPYDFQSLVAGLLRGMGYHVSWVAPPGPDRGVDVIAHLDPLGIERGRIKVQVKRRADRISVPEIRSFLAVLGEEDVGIFVTTAGFTADSESEARQQERRRIMLLDSRRLFDLWVEHYEKIPEEQRRLLPLRAVHYLSPVD